MATSNLLSLPSELRIKVYEYILTFSGPIKLRQIVRGSEKTNLLRVNRQIYQEALPVLFDVNTVSATRNDFCTRTDDSLKTPVRSDHIRHLLITNFGESIACNFLLDRCDVCEHPAEGFLDALRTMPQLKTVVIEYSTQLTKFRHFREAMASRSKDAELYCTAVGKSRLRCSSLEHVDITFEHLALTRTWPALTALSSSMPSESDEEDALTALRKIHADLPDKLWLLICARQYGRGMLQAFAPDVRATWTEPADVESMDLASRSGRLLAFNQALHTWLSGQTAAQCREYLISAREWQAKRGSVHRWIRP